MKRYFGSLSFYRQALMIGVPVMLQSLIQSLVSLVDNFMVAGLGAGFDVRRIRIILPCTPISSHSSKESQTAYRALGCTPAEEINARLAAEEPFDVKLEYRL